jgi:SAM-dependent methyltransferase
MPTPVDDAVHSPDPSQYDAAFYADLVSGSARAADIVLPFVYGVFNPSSVIDIGCGQGTWLAAAEALGSERLTGMDGPWVDRGALRSARIDFRPADLAGEIVIERRHDLCISVEVAEHLPPERAEAFVDALCRASDVVLFSAAVPQQGGTGHANEERASRWAARFEARGYACFDLVRGAIWTDERVAWWYRQNIFVYVARSSPRFTAFAAAPLPPAPRDLVHPVAFEEKVAWLSAERTRLLRWIEHPTVGQAMRSLWRAFFSRRP